MEHFRQRNNWCSLPIRNQSRKDTQNPVSLKNHHPSLELYMCHAEKHILKIGTHTRKSRFLFKLFIQVFAVKSLQQSYLVELYKHCCILRPLQRESIGLL